MPEEQLKEEDISAKPETSQTPKSSINETTKEQNNPEPTSTAPEQQQTGKENFQ